MDLSFETPLEEMDEDIFVSQFLSSEEMQEDLVSDQRENPGPLSPLESLLSFGGVFSWQSQPPVTYDTLSGVKQEPFAFESVPNRKGSDSPQNHVDSHAPNTSDLDIVVHEQPAIEVRTRTPSENRTFSVTLMVVGDYRKHDVVAVRAGLVYAGNVPEAPNPTILGGTKTVRIGSDGRVVFNNLCLSEASAKHKEREFRLEFSPLTSDGKTLPLRRYSRAFYAYSHKRVLSRRRNLRLRALNSPEGPLEGGPEMHVIGSPFISGPALRCLLRTPHGDVVCPALDLYSESVLFFRLPPYPAPADMFPEGTRIPVSLVATNDGKTFSNPLPFAYVKGRAVSSL